MKEKLKNILKKSIRNPIIATVLIIFALLILFFPEISLLFGLTSFYPMQAVIKFLTFLRSFVFFAACPIAAVYICFNAIPICISIVRQILAVRAVKKALKANRLNYKIKRSLYYAGHLTFGIKINIRAHKEDINIVTVPARRKHAKYHFADANKIELWVKKYMAVGGRDRAKVIDLGDWQKKGSIKLPKWENGKNYLVFDREPMEITSSEYSDFKFKISGDKMFSTFIVYTLEDISKINFD